MAGGTALIAVSFAIPGAPTRDYLQSDIFATTARFQRSATGRAK
jgi:hypothetical protein